MKEQTIETQLKKAIEASGGLCWKFVSPGTSGVPDRICLMKNKAVFVELKAPGKQPRPIQYHRLGQLQAQGFQTFVIDSIKSIEEVLDALQSA